MHFITFIVASLASLAAASPIVPESPAKPAKRDLSFQDCVKAECDILETFAASAYQLCVDSCLQYPVAGPVVTAIASTQAPVLTQAIVSTPVPAPSQTPF